MFSLTSDARRFNFCQLAVACPKWPGVAAWNIILSKLRFEFPGPQKLWRGFYSIYGENVAECDDEGNEVVP